MLVVCLTILLLLIHSSVFVHCQLHFASIGNWGSGSPTQLSVADTLKIKAHDSKVSFLVSPGSNFLASGIQNLNDSAWDTHYSKPFEGPELFLPFFPVLGSADWKGNFTALVDKSIRLYEKGDVSQLKAEVPKWTFPNWWYHYTQHFQDATRAGAAIGARDASVGLVFVDTYILSDNFAYSNITKLHWDALKQTVTTLGKIFDWTIVVGHAALVSSGASKGDAKLRKTLGRFLHEHNVDMYLSGSDYDMEIIKDGSMVYVNCGSGSRADSIPRLKVKGSVAYVGKPGFCHHILAKNTLTTELIDGISGDVLHSFVQYRSNTTTRDTLGRFRLYSELPPVTFIPIPEIELGKPKEGDWFVRTVGSLGLLVLIYLFLVLAVTIGQKMTKIP